MVHNDINKCEKHVLYLILMDITYKIIRYRKFNSYGCFVRLSAAKYIVSKLLAYGLSPINFVLVICLVVNSKLKLGVQ